MTAKQNSMRPAALRPAHAIAVLAMLLGAPAAFAAGAPGAADIEARYQSERAACAQRATPEDQASCLREAAAARAEARQGQLDDRQASYDRNAVARCDALPLADQEACRRRAREEGAVSGSVSSGGILREYREITLTPPPPPADAGVTAPAAPQPAK